MNPSFGYDAVAVWPATVADWILISSPFSRMTSVGCAISSAVVIVPVKSSLAGSSVSSTVLCVGRTVVGRRRSGGVGAAFGAGVAAATGGRAGVGATAGGGAAELQAASRARAGRRLIAANHSEER